MLRIAVGQISCESNTFATFTVPAGGLATTMLSERLQSIDLRSHLRRRRTYPGVVPVLHLDHIYYDGRVEVVKLDLPRTRLALMASDHLPLVAELKIQFR